MVVEWRYSRGGGSYYTAATCCTTPYVPIISRSPLFMAGACHFYYFLVEILLLFLLADTGPDRKFRSVKQR